MGELEYTDYASLSSKGLENLLRVFNEGEGQNLLHHTWPSECEQSADKIFHMLYRSPAAALWAAASAGLKGVVEYLVNSGVSINSASLAPRQHAVTAMDEAIWGGHIGLTAWIEANGGKRWTLGDVD